MDVALHSTCCLPPCHYAGTRSCSIWPETRTPGGGYPHTPLAQLAMEEGMVSPQDDLLIPRFYIRPGLEEYIQQVQGKG
jgi:hypothetical protein